MADNHFKYFNRYKRCSRAVYFVLEKFRTIYYFKQLVFRNLIYLFHSTHPVPNMKFHSVQLL